MNALIVLAPAQPRNPRDHSNQTGTAASRAAAEQQFYDSYGCELGTRYLRLPQLIKRWLSWRGKKQLNEESGMTDLRCGAGK